MFPESLQRSIKIKPGIISGSSLLKLGIARLFLSSLSVTVARTSRQHRTTTRMHPTHASLTVASSRRDIPALE